MADDAARALAPHGVPRPGGHDAAAVPPRATGGRDRRRPRPPARAAGCASVAVCRHGDARSPDTPGRCPALDVARHYARRWCGQRDRPSRMAGDYPRGRPAARAPGGRGTRQHRDQYRAGGGTRAGRPHHRRRRTGARVSHQRRFHTRRVLRAVALAPRAASRLAARRASGLSDARRDSLCALHPCTPHGRRPRGGVRILRQRALGAAATRGEGHPGARSGRLRCSRGQPGARRPDWGGDPPGSAAAVVERRLHRRRVCPLRRRLPRLGVGPEFRSPGRDHGGHRDRLAGGRLDRPGRRTTRSRRVGAGPRACAVVALLLWLIGDRRVGVGTHRQSPRHSVDADARRVGTTGRTCAGTLFPPRHGGLAQRRAVTELGRPRRRGEPRR